MMPGLTHSTSSAKALGTRCAGFEALGSWTRFHSRSLRPLGSAINAVPAYRPSRATIAAAGFPGSNHRPKRLYASNLENAETLITTVNNVRLQAQLGWPAFQANMLKRNAACVRRAASGDDQDQQQERLSSATVFPPHSSNCQFRLGCDRARSCRWRMSGRLLAVKGGQRLRDGETCRIYRPAGFVMNGNGHSLIQVA